MFSSGILAQGAAGFAGFTSAKVSSVMGGDGGASSSTDPALSPPSFDFLSASRAATVARLHLP
eukprot:7335247-Alexandrium_andersonii.AAC.1